MRDHPFSTLAALSEAERFELLVTSVSDYAIYMLDAKGSIVSWNTGAQRFKGYSREEVIGKHFSIFYTDADRREGVPDRALQIADTEGKFEAENWRVRKDGSRFWAHVVIDPIRNQDGHVIGYAKITRDVTERKVAQEALRRSEEQFRLLVQGVTDYAIFMLAPDGTIFSWNAGAARIKGYEREEIVGKHFSCFYTADDQAAHVPAETLATAARDGRVELEGWRVRKDGSRFWAHVVVDAIYNEDGTLVGFAKITRDITERKETAASLERANLALFQSQKLEAIGQLTGGIAHDLNNLLAVISNGLQVLSAQSQNYLDTKMIHSMQRAIERGASLTQQLLSFARQQPLKPETHDLSKLIHDFEPMLRRAGNSSVRLELAMSSAATSLVDAARFEAALLNLIVNACDAMPEGGLLKVTTERVDLTSGEVGMLAAGSFIRVRVSDSGTGMSPEVVARVFEPFYTTKEPGKGTGLGLSQVYGFITQSGGDVKIASEEGKGTVIDLYLPAIDATCSDHHGRANQVPVETVLVVEDDPDLLDGAAELFRSIGYGVESASNATQAIAALEAGPAIDILFSDIVMPNGASGIELARQVRVRFPAVKIVLASGYPLSALRQDHGALDEFIFVQLEDTEVRKASLPRVFDGYDGYCQKGRASPLLIDVIDAMVNEANTAAEAPDRLDASRRLVLVLPFHDIKFLPIAK